MSESSPEALMWRALVESMPQPLVILSSSGQVVAGNEPAADLLGASSWQDVWLNPFEGALDPHSEELAVRGARVTQVAAQLAPLPSAHWRALLSPLSPLIGQEETSAADEKMARAEQLLELGYLATGIAHELKNPLTSILNYAQYLLRKYQDHLMDSRDRERLQRIVYDVERIDHFVHDLMELARPQEQTYRVMDLERVLIEASALCAEVFSPRGVTLVREVEPDADLRICGSKTELVQVLRNLLHNAAAAAEEGSGSVWLRARRSGAHVIVEVEDNGHGMSPRTLSKLFEPFFTTRRGRGGTGLGMVLVRVLVERHGGQVKVWSEEGVGTRFTLKFLAAMAHGEVS